MSDTIERLLPAWIIIDGDFCTYSCENHAREYADTNGIPQNEGYEGYSLTREGYGLTADVYPVHSWDSYETDYPVARECGQYLDNVRLTPDGRDYMRENDFPAWLMAAHGIDP